MSDSESTPSPLDGPRLTPYEIVFTEGDFESRVFPRISQEAAEGAISSLHREKFEFLSTTGEVVREVTPEDAPPEALEQYRALLFHAFHYWSGGKTLYVMDTSVVRYLVESSPGLDDWTFQAPGRSLYLQLPANLFWSSISPGIPPEPVDGFFVTVADNVDAFGKEYETIEILTVLGIRRSRAGFSVIPVASEAGPGIPAPWEGEARPEGDFRNVLPGGEISGLYSMLTTGEVLKLVSLCFWYIQSFPETLVEVRASEPRADPGEPPPTQLAHLRVTLGEATEGLPGRT